MHSPVMKNTPGDKVLFIFLILIYFFMLFATALNLISDKNTYRAIQDVPSLYRKEATRKCKPPQSAGKEVLRASR